MKSHMNRSIAAAQRRASAKSKQSLLPLPERHMTDVLLSTYLAFAACRSGHGSRHLLFELVHATYLSYFLWQDGFGEAEHHLYSNAERALDCAAGDGYALGIWTVRPGDEESISLVLRIYDHQIQTVPVGTLSQAKSRLRLLFGELRNSTSAG